VRGKTDTIRRWKCQACGKTVSERKFTPLYRLKTAPSRIGLVMFLLANGLDPSAAAHVFRHDHRTIRRWLTRGGKHAAALHDLYFRRLRCAFLQLDELVATTRGDEHFTFVWSAVDAVTKIIPQIHVGRRMITDAYTFAHGLKARTKALGFSGQVQTAFAERANLTLRELIAPLARRAWSIARSQDSLLGAIHWGVCSYHFIRPHASLQASSAYPRTPAMAADLTDHIWTPQDVLHYKIRIIAMHS